MKQKILSLNKEFGNNIFTRSRISSFFDEINQLKEEKIVIDFENTQFISRSCADEYLKLKSKSKKTIIERNMSDEIISMIKLVKHQQNSIIFSSEIDSSFKIPV